MLLENLNEFAYKNTLFYERNGDIYVKFNLSAKTKKKPNKNRIYIEGIKVASAEEFRATIKDLKSGNYNILSSYATNETPDQNGTRQIYEVKKESISGSMKFMESSSIRYIEQDEKRIEELEKQPFAESFLKILPPRIICDESFDEVEFNFQNMKDKEATGRFINHLNIKSNNKLVKSNIEALNDFVFSKIKEHALNSKENSFKTLNFSRFDIAEILNKKSFKKIFDRKEEREKLENTAQKLATNLNIYFRSISKSHKKDLERFRKYIVNHKNKDLHQIEEIAKTRKTERDKINTVQTTLITNIREAAKILAGRVYDYTVFNMFNNDKKRRNQQIEESQRIPISEKNVLKLVGEKYKEIV